MSWGVRHLVLLATLFAICWRCPPFVSGWGPVTHQDIGQRCLNNITQVLSSEHRPPFDRSIVPSTNASMWSFVLGCSAPDAFNNELLLPKPDPSNNGEMHNFLFAGYLLLYAQQTNPPALGLFDPVAFALGFGSHLAQDAVGHNPLGFLGDQYTTDQNSLLFVVDAYLIGTGNYSATELFGNYTAEVASLVYGATEYFYNETGTCVASNSSSSSSAAGRFVDIDASKLLQFPNTGGVVSGGDDECLYPQSQLSLAIQAFDALVKAELVADKLVPMKVSAALMYKLNYQNDTSTSEILPNLEMAMGCSIRASLYWMAKMKSSGDPALSESALDAYVDSIIDTDLCRELY
eukprot:TRINITY_DN3972_c0_g1_i1.p1 TRINITY_DN3972_c0_g1~~TRINITY_DN3972_c0_g1_i1.p1  ORF type:complete len:348 (-),score=59.63 TRINITY_DN3972_c0_g1_i1:264-1307(-)